MGRSLSRLIWCGPIELARAMSFPVRGRYRTSFIGRGCSDLEIWADFAACLPMFYKKIRLTACPDHPLHRGSLAVTTHVLFPGSRLGTQLPEAPASSLWKGVVRGDRRPAS